VIDHGFGDRRAPINSAQAALLRVSEQSPGRCGGPAAADSSTSGP